MSGIAALAGMTLLGLVLGSFGNVVIWRLPRSESLSSPPSHCPACGHPVRWRDNVPVVSWLLLRGRCRDCGQPISPRYPLVEAASALLWLASGVAFGASLRALACACLLYMLLLLSLIDAEVYRLPNSLVATLAAIGVVFAGVSQATGVPSAPLLDVGWGSFWGPLAVASLGTALGIGVSGSSAALYGLIRRRTGLGMGDVKLLAAIGVFTGPYVVMVYVIGNILGAAAVLLTIPWRRARALRAGSASVGEAGVSGDLADADVVGADAAVGSDPPQDGDPISARRIPFGPYLAAATALTVFAGPALWAWYLSLVGM